MDSILLLLKPEHAFPAIAPVLERLKDVQAALTVTSVHFEGLSRLLFVKRCDPD